MSAAELIRNLAYTLVPMILSYAVHECAHAWMALKLGDPTAKEEGHLTLDPTVHTDLWGTVLIPAMSVFAWGFGYLGYAKPAPIRVERMHPRVGPRLGNALVALSGPLSNALVALVMVTLMAILAHAHVPITKRAIAIEDVSLDDFTPIGAVMFAMFEVNVALALFNLFPIPPLDGHRLLPRLFDPILAPLKRWGFALIFAVFLFLPRVGNAVFFGPMTSIMRHLLRWFGVG